MPRSCQAISVYDLTSLHARGNEARTKRGSQQKTSRRVSRNSGASFTGADDVTKAWKVSKRRARPKPVNDDDNEDEVFDLTGIESSDDPGDVEDHGTSRKAKGKGRAVDAEPSSSITNGQMDGESSQKKTRTRRRRKRRKVDGHLTFLDTQPTGSQLVDDSRGHLSERQLQTPSSDLLKCIHHIASRYYSERGQLWNAPQEHQLDRRQKRLQKLKAAARSDSDSNEASQDEDSTREEEGSSDAEGSSAHSMPEDGTAGRSEKRLHRDMYMTLDGTALVAIGMLLQEYVVRVLTPDESLDVGPEISEAPST